MNNKYNKIAKKVGGGVMGLHSLYSLYEVGLVRNKTNLSTFTRCDLVKVGGKKVLRGLKRVGGMGVVMISVLSMALAPVGNVPVALAATYTFTQTDWAGGATSTTAVHPTNQSGWTYASTTNSQIATSTAGQLTLKITASSTTQTSDGVNE